MRVFSSLVASLPHAVGALTHKAPQITGRLGDIAVRHCSNPPLAPTWGDKLAILALISPGIISATLTVGFTIREILYPRIKKEESKTKSQDMA